MAAPIILGNDIRNMNDYTCETLTNPEIISINQDAPGKQAVKTRDEGELEVFARSMADGSVAVGLLNRKDAKTASIRIND